MFGVELILTATGLSKGVHIPMATYSGKKIIGMGKWEQGVSEAIKEAKSRTKERTWTTMP